MSKSKQPDPDTLYRILQDLKIYTRELEDFKTQKRYRGLIKKYSHKIEKYREL